MARRNKDLEKIYEVKMRKYVAEQERKRNELKKKNETKNN